jgi:hypothetical protein
LPFLRFLAVCVLSVWFSAGAFADNVKISSFSSGNWTGGAYVDRDSRKFSYCGIGASYRSGIAIHFAVDGDFDWRIGFGSPELGLVPGRNYDVAYTIDGSAASRLTGIARSRELLIVELPSRSELFDRFRSGLMLSVLIQGRVHQFKLTGTSRALAALLECARDNGVGTSVATVPRSADPPNPPAVTHEVSAQDRLEAVRFVANVLARAELRDFRFMTEDDLADKRWPEIVRKSDVAWISKEELGFLHIFRTNVISIDDGIAAAIASDAKACNGDFASGKRAPEPGTELKRAFTACRDPQKPFAVEYIFVPRRNGLAYRFATFRFDAVAPENKPLGEALKAI